VLGENKCRFVHHKSHMSWPRARTRAAAVEKLRLNSNTTARPAHAVTPKVSVTKLQTDRHNRPAMAKVREE
jgi:hypothetical protein